MKTLLIGDLHIEEKAIGEIKDIFVNDIFPIKADQVIQLGDWFDVHRPSPAEIDFSCWLVTELKKRYNSLTVLSGTGRHEFLNKVKITEHLKYLGVKLVSSYYPLVIDGKKCLFGHFMTNKSILNFGDYEKKLSDLKQFDYAILAHQHLLQSLIKDKAYHIGSIRWQHWGEVKDTYKRVMLIEEGKLKEIKLKTPIAMKDVISFSELDDLPANLKVRPVFTSQEQFMNQVNLLSKYKEKFYELAPPLLKFKKQDTKKKESKTTSIEAEIEKIENKEVRELILETLRGVR